MSDHVLPKPKSDLIFRTLADGGLIFSPESEVYFSVNAVGARIWSLLPPASDTLESLLNALAPEYSEVAADVLRSDVEELLTDLAIHGLVEPSP